MDSEAAIKRVRQVLDGSVAARVAIESYVGLCRAYAYGPQWTSIGATPTGGSATMRLRTIIDADRADVRVTFNEIAPRIMKLHSRLAPDAIATQVEPASWANNDQVAALVANSRMEIAIEELRAKRAVKKADLQRLVDGSAYIRRGMERGEPVVSRDASGRPRLNGKGQPVMLPTLNHYWGVEAVYSVIRDPMASDIHFEGEDVVIVEKARPISWLTRHFGITEADLGGKTATMGELLEYQDFLNSALGQDSGLARRGDSKMPGVMVGECWLRDEDTDKQGRWPWYGMAVRNTGGSDTANRQAKWLTLENEQEMFGLSPYHGLPLHHLVCFEQAECPIGRGVPWSLIQAQDQGNLARTQLLRMMRAHGNTKYMYLKNAVEEPEKIFGPNPWRPIPVNPNQHGLGAVQRLTPPPLDPAMMMIINSIPEGIDRLLNMNPVQAGYPAGKHGESGRALQARIDQADTVLNLLNDDDEDTVNEALTGTLFDVVRNEPIEVLTELLSGQYTADQIATLKQQDIGRSVVGVKVVPGSLRPRTRQEVKDEAAMDLNLQMTDPVSARRNMYMTRGIIVDVKECRAIDLQTLEIGTLLDGRPVGVELDQDHDAHLWRLAFEAESMRASQYSDAQKDALKAHRLLHKQAQVILAQEEARQQQILNPQAQAQPAPQGAAMELPPAQPEGQPTGAEGEQPFEQPPYQPEAQPEFGSAAFQPVAAGAPEAEPAGYPMQ